MSSLTELPLSPESWGLGPDDVEMADIHGRPGLRFRDGVPTPLARGVKLGDGILEMDLLVPSERCFHGLVWHVAGPSHELFFVRPHQVGNPDAIQYTPVTNGISAGSSSIGWFDTVYLPIEAGRNELIVAVSEDLGGWGAQARFTDHDGD